MSSTQTKGPMTGEIFVPVQFPGAPRRLELDSPLQHLRFAVGPLLRATVLLGHDRVVDNRTSKRVNSRVRPRCIANILRREFFADFNILLCKRIQSVPDIRSHLINSRHGRHVLRTAMTALTIRPAEAHEYDEIARASFSNGKRRIRTA
jgi:hypothetical protein